MRNIFKSAFGVIAGLASIIGVGLLFIRSAYAVATACAFYCIAITTLGIAIYRSILKSLEFGNKGTYRHLASFGTFVCDDGKKALFENVRLIQAKVPFLDKIEVEVANINYFYIILELHLTVQLKIHIFCHAANMSMFYICHCYACIVYFNIHILSY